MAAARNGPHLAIVGAGIAGLTLAAALRGSGFSCTVHERTQTLREVGAGIQLSPNASRLLIRLGLRPQLTARATRVEAMEVRGWKGNPIARTVLGEECEAAFGAPYYSIHRAHLHAELAALVGAEGVRLGRRVRAVHHDGGTPVLEFADGTRRAADVVVGADGVRSSVRRDLVGDAPVFSGLVAYRALVPAALLPDGARQPLVRSWLGPGRHVICYPVAGGELINLVAVAPSTEVGDESWSAQGDPAELVGAFEGWHAPVRLLAQATTEVKRWALHDRDPAGTWAADRVVLIGDAAHPMLPFLGQGANQAVEDAFELASALSDSGGEGVDAALARYASARATRTRQVQRASREHVRSMHLDDGPLQLARDRQLHRTSDLAARAWLYAHDIDTASLPAA